MSSSNWFSRPKAEPKPKFNPFANFGLKSKKPASLALAPSPTFGASPGHSPTPSPYTNRPPSKSVSSRDDSIGPTTPSDTSRVSIATQNSLLTLSDADPFAARGISFTQTPTDASSLSKSPLSEFTSDFLANSAETLPARFSFASSSSRGGILDPSLPHPTPRTGTAPVSRKPSTFSTETSLDDAWESLSISKSAFHLPTHASSSVAEVRPPPSQMSSNHSSRRARGLTESSTTRPDCLPEISRNHSPDKRPITLRSGTVSPRVVIRQASHPRLAEPPTAPLPQPPVQDQLPVEIERDRMYRSSSTASGFALALPAVKRRKESQDSPNIDKYPDCTLLFSHHPGSSDSDLPTTMTGHSPTSPSPKSLKKAASHQSLKKHTGPPSPATPTPPLTPALDIAVRKQRSFHHPKIPIPPIPNALRTTGSHHSSPSSDTLNSNETKRGNILPSSGRKRLFSSSTLRRPSTTSNGTSSASIRGEDDTRSVFSLKSEGDHRNAAPSVRSLVPDDFGSSISQEYMPQHILSPADMLKIEASMQKETKKSQSVRNLPTRNETRHRGLSNGTTRTKELPPKELAPSTGSIRSSRSGSGIIRSQSTGQQTNGLTLPVHQQFSRPSHSLEDLADRRNHDKVASSTKFASLPPPPRPRRSTLANAHSAPTSPLATGLSPPPRKGTALYLEKGLHRRSLMRKPSFLDIDDTDVESEEGPYGEPTVKLDISRLDAETVSASFLDLARESFDTGR